jgi:hypothetical protein
MPEWFCAVVPGATDSSPERLAVTLLTAAFFGMAVAVIYFLTQRRSRAETASLVSTIVLLTVLLAMVTLVIGGNLARAFGLVGVLSIVRFRTIVEDTRDTAFVIFAVITGMAVGSDFVMLAAIGVPIMGAVAWALSVWSNGAFGGGRGNVSTLIIKLGVSATPEAVVNPTLTKHLVWYRVTGVGTARQGAAIELTYNARLRPEVSAVSLILELNRVEGVQSVEWKEPSNS